MLRTPIKLGSLLIAIEQKPLDFSLVADSSTWTFLTALSLEKILKILNKISPIPTNTNTLLLY